MITSNAELQKRVEEFRQSAVVRCKMMRPLAGGQPAGEKGLRAFVKHHLKLEPDTPEFDEAIARIQKEEIGERDTTPEGGEVKTEEVYAVNVIRRSEHGPFILEHMVKALLKQAASRLGLFMKKKGSKGDLAEMGTVLAHGASLKNPERPWEIYLDGAKTEFAVLSGSVGTPQGKKSIRTHVETAPEGTEFAFEIRWPDGKLAKKDMLNVIAATREIGIGSALSMGYGRFEAEVEMD